MPEPTEEQLKEYARTLPDIYKYVLDAFAHASSQRRANEHLDFAMVRQWVNLKDDFYRDQDIQEAVEKLEAASVLEKWIDPETGKWPASSGSRYPTNFGERLVTALTGVQPVRGVVPDLPKPSWAGNSDVLAH